MKCSSSVAMTTSDKKYTNVILGEIFNTLCQYCEKIVLNYKSMRNEYRMNKVGFAVPTHNFIALFYSSTEKISIAAQKISQKDFELILLFCSVFQILKETLKSATKMVEPCNGFPFDPTTRRNQKYSIECVDRRFRNTATFNQTFQWAGRPTEKVSMEQGGSQVPLHRRLWQKSRLYNEIL